MARAVMYQAQNPAGAWQRSSGTVPWDQAVSPGTYRVNPLDGSPAQTIEVTGGAFTEQLVRCTGNDYLEGDFQIPDATAFLAFFSINQISIKRGACLSWFGNSGWIGAWDGRPHCAVQADTGYMLCQGDPVPIGTRMHVLFRGYESAGNLIIEGAVHTGAWATIPSVQQSGGQFNFTTGTTGNVRVYERNDIPPPIHGLSAFAARTAIYPGIAPDISLTAVRDHFIDGSQIADPSISLAEHGQAFIDCYGPPQDLVAGINHGSGGSFTSFGSFD